MFTGTFVFEPCKLCHQQLGVEELQRGSNTSFGARLSLSISRPSPEGLTESASMTADERKLTLAAQEAVRRGDFASLKQLLQKAQKTAEEQRQINLKERNQTWDPTAQRLTLLPSQMPQGFGNVLGLTDDNHASSPRFNEDGQRNDRASHGSVAKSGDYARWASNPREPSSPRQPSSPRRSTPLRAATGQGDNGDDSAQGKGRSSISVRGASFVRSPGPSLSRPADSSSVFGMRALGFEASATAPQPASAEMSQEPKETAEGVFGPVIGTFF